MHLSATSNEYQQQLGDLFDRCPKAVIAAIAVSVLTQGGDFLDETRIRFLAEWTALHENGIVQQRPPSPAAIARRAERVAARRAARQA